MNEEIAEREEVTSEFDLAAMRERLRGQDLKLAKGMKPYGPRILVRLVGLSGESAGGLIVTPTVAKQNKATRCGRVVRLGSRWNDDSKSHDVPIMGLDEGDYVLFNSYAGIEVTHLEDFFILNDSEVLCRLDPEIGDRMSGNFDEVTAIMAEVSPAARARHV